MHLLTHCNTTHSHVLVLLSDYLQRRSIFILLSYPLHILAGFSEKYFFPCVCTVQAFVNRIHVSCLFIFQRQQKQGIMQRSVSTRSANYHRIQNNSMLPNSLPAVIQPSTYPDIFANQGAISSTTARWSQNLRHSKTLDRSPSQPPLTSPVPMKVNNSFQSPSNQFIGSNTINRRPPSAHSNSEPKLSMPSRSKGEMNG